MRRAIIGALAIVSGMAGVRALAQPVCTTEWSDQFNSPFIGGTVNDSVVWDDGTGPAFYVIGNFNNGIGRLTGETPDLLSRGVMKWNGTQWSIVGPSVRPGNIQDGLNGAVYVFLTSVKSAATTWDPDGNGPIPSRLVVGGSYTPQGGNAIAQFDGTTWTFVGASCPIRVVLDMVEYRPDPAQPGSLIAAGFDSAGDPIVARFNVSSNSWITIGSMPLGPSDASFRYYVSRLEVHDEDGSGPGAPALFVSGKFMFVEDSSGIIDAAGLAKWNGSSWSGVPGFPGYQENRGTYFGIGGLTALASLDSGDGASLWVAGVAHNGAEAVYRLRNGALELMLEDQAYSFALFGGPSGPTVHAAAPARLLRRAAAGTWEQVGPVAGGASLQSPAYGTFALHMRTVDVDFAGPQPAKLFVGSVLQQFNQIPRPTGMLWDGSAFEYLPVEGGNLGLSGVVNVKQLDTDGSGPLGNRLFVFGDLDVGGASVFGGESAVFNGSDYEPLPPFASTSAVSDAGASGGITDMDVYDAGTGPEMYATLAQRKSVSDDGNSYLIKLSGSTWSDVALANLGDGTDPVVLQKLLAANVNAQPSLIVMGQFDRIAEQDLGWCARLSGTTWTAMNAGLPAQPYFSAAVLFNGVPHILVSDSLNGVNLFDSRVMRWNGAAWEVVGGATFDHTANGVPSGLRVLDLGSGPALYVVGSFSSVGGVSDTARIARWNGTAWQSVTTAFSTGPANISDVGVFDFGSGPRLSVLASGNGLPTNLRGLLKLDGSAWTQVPGFSTSRPATRMFDPTVPGVDGLFLTGFMPTTYGGNTSYGLARLTVTCSCPADFNGVNGVTVQDIFDFLAAWFGISPAADFNASGAVTVQDIFDFLAAWFQGCP